MDSIVTKEDIRRQMEDFARFLLAKNYYLTALEFYHETQEDGDELTILKEWFNMNYPISEERSAESKPSLRPVSAVEVNKDEKIAILEYELRIAYEDLEKMRERLMTLQSQIQTQGVSSTMQSGRQKDQTVSTPPHNRLQNSGSTENADPAGTGNIYVEPIKTHEKRILNHLIKKYLLVNGYKLTALTLNDEVADQRLDDTSDIGSPVGFPPELFHFVRAYNTLPSSMTFKQAKKSRESRSDLRLVDPDTPVSPSVSVNGSLDKLADTSADDITENTTEKKAEDASAEPASEPPKEPVKKMKFTRKHMRLITTTKVHEEEAQPEDEMTRALREELQKRMAILGDGLIDDAEGFVRLMADSLPHIVPNVLLNKREELIPVLVGTIGLHPDAKTRDSLTHMLFNLIKKPDDKQRKIILAGCIALARTLGADRTGEELLPQCWEQISHKHVERRILVADFCGALAPYTRPDLRSSLMPSILSQLVEDKTPSVRQAVARNLASLLKFIDDESKFSMLMDMVMKLILDDTVEASTTSIKEFFPHFTEWSQSHGFLCLKLIPSLLKQMEDLAKSIIKEKDQTSSQVLQASQLFQVLIQYVEQTIPYLQLEVLLTAPFASEILNDFSPERYDGFQFQDPIVIRLQKCFINSFDKVEDISKSWAGLDWIVGTFMPKLVKMTEALPHSSPCIDYIAKLFHCFCVGFGSVFSREIVKSYMAAEISRLTSKIRDIQGNELGFLIEYEHARQRLIRVYLTGVLGCLDLGQLVNTIRVFIMNISLEESQWKRSQLSCIVKCFPSLCKIDKFDETVLGMLCEMDSSKDSHVKISVVESLKELGPLVNPDQILKRIVPSLVIYVSDADVNVKKTAISALGKLATTTHNQEVIDRISTQLELIIAEGQLQPVNHVLATFAAIIPQSHEAFRDTYDIRGVIFVDLILPSLRVLVSDPDYLESANRSRAQSMIKDIEATYQSDLESAAKSGDNVVTRLFRNSNPIPRLSGGVIGIFNRAEKDEKEKEKEKEKDK